MSNRQPAPALGASSLLAAFSVLCLLVFALLTLSAVRSDQALSQSTAQAVSDYYQADAEANRILAQLRSGHCPPGVRTEEAGVFAYACPLDENQRLQARVRINEAGGYQILVWQLVAEGSWQIDDSIPVYGGGEDQLSGR